VLDLILEVMNLKMLLNFNHHPLNLIIHHFVSHIIIRVILNHLQNYFEVTYFIHYFSHFKIILAGNLNFIINVLNSFLIIYLFYYLSF
jgi:hypothetical protein